MKISANTMVVAATLAVSAASKESPNTKKPVTR